jgi:radical SAM superfamily enzyme YgiQ (UPF0313 family)
MKILFIKPPKNRRVVSLTRYEPLEFEYLAASVSDHDTDIFDMRIEKNLMKKLESYNPDLVGITAYSCDVKMVKSILHEIKKYNNKIKTVVGGNHATFLPEDFNESSVDTIFLGYADHTFPKYIKALKEGTDVREIDNLGIVEDRGIYFTEKRPVLSDLDSLPLPARHLTRKYRHKYHDSLRNKSALGMSSRGCPFRCTFCACWKLMNGKYKTRNVDSIVQELKSLPDDISMVYFSDDNTVHNVKRAWELAEKIKEHRINKKLQMYARVDTIVKNPELFHSLKEAGLEYLTVGFESVTDNGLEKLNKRTTVQMNDQAITILKDLGIYINAHFIVNPDFTSLDFNSLLQYVKERNLFRPAYPVLTPLPGTQLFEETRNQLVIKDYDYFDFAHSIMPTKLQRKEFYFQLAQLYNKSYSLIRYLKYLYTRKVEGHSGKPDGISILKLILIRIFAVFPYIKMKNTYRSEPVYQEQP